MKVLFIGGTGIISAACTHLAISRGIDVTLLNRGRHSDRPPAGVKTLSVDIEDAAAVSHALAAASFDAVVDWIAFEPAQVERDIALFRGHTRQYIFISSASAYQKPSTLYLITESTPLAIPPGTGRTRSRKIACAERLMRAYREEACVASRIAIVRPSLTYAGTRADRAGDQQPSGVRSYTVVDLACVAEGR